MANLVYTRTSDNQARAATITVNTGTEDTAYPSANLADHQPEKPARLSTTTGSWVFDMGSATRLDFAAIIHHNLTPGLEVRLQGNASNVWTSPTLNQAFTIPAVYADFFPPNPWLNLKTLVPIAANRTFQFWRLVIVGSNALPISIGEVVLASTLRDLGIRNISWGSERMWRRPAVLHETDLLVRHTYDFGTTVRAVTVETQATDVTLREIETWYRDAQGIAKPFMIVPLSSENDAWMVSFVEPQQQYQREYLNVNTATMIFQELSRGLYP